MKIKTNELKGRALDWAVATACGLSIEMFGKCFEASWLHDRPDGSRSRITGTFRPSVDWSHGGPLIDRFCPLFTLCKGMVRAELLQGDALGETHLIAACRAIVAAKIGQEVEVPDEIA